MHFSNVVSNSMSLAVNRSRFRFFCAVIVCHVITGTMAKDTIYMEIAGGEGIEYSGEFSNS
jgi:hypothetical protein